MFLKCFDSITAYLVWALINFLGKTDAVGFGEPLNLPTFPRIWVVRRCSQKMISSETVSGNACFAVSYQSSFAARAKAPERLNPAKCAQ